MGGFFLCPRTPDLSLKDIEVKHQESLEVFSRKGLVLDKRLIRDTFVVFRFCKIMAKHDHVLELRNGDFVLSCGIMVYDKKIGKPALETLYEDFISGKSIDSTIIGNFSVIIFCNSALYIFGDYAGYYQIYCNLSKSIFSNSFMAVARAIEPGEPSAQEFFEYVLHGFFVHESTLFPNVSILDGKRVWRVLPGIKATPRQPPSKPITAASTLLDVTQLVAEELSEYFETLGNLLDEPFGLALSGGYDTRLMLALIRHIGIAPYLYVYGDADSSDVKVAKKIGAGENILIEHVDKSAFPRVTPQEFAAGIERDVFFFDGIKPLGIIDDGSDLSTRLDRAEKANLQLNGAGGEIYREIWNVSDRKIGIVRFLRMRYDIGVYSFCRAPFDVHEYFARFTEKTQAILDIDRPWLERHEAEMLFPYLRNILASPNNSANNQISYSLVPFMEPRFILPSYDIPIAFKYEGCLHAELIKRFDTALAKYPSSYGIKFSDPIPLRYRLKGRLERHIPLQARIFKRRRSAANPAEARPYYLHREFLKEVVDMDNLRISQFVDVDKIDDPELLSRALSVELLLSHL